MEKEILSILYITLFLALSIVLCVVTIPSKEEYNDYRKSRRVLAFALFLVSVSGVVRTLFHPRLENHFGDFCIMLMLCYIFTCLNYLSFLYMIETSRAQRKKVMMATSYIAPVLVLTGTLGFIFPHFIRIIEIVLSCICLMMHFVLLTGSLREYDKYTLQMSNYFDGYPDIRWIPSMLWATFITACLTIGSFFYNPLAYFSGAASMFVYTCITVKLLSFIPENIHRVKASLKTKEIVAVDHTEQTAAAEIPETQIQAKEEALPQQEEVKSDIISQRNAKRNEKVADLMEKWVAGGNFTRPDINIKDVATEMGTNTHYLSTYINDVLQTSFAIWLNRLRIERSKEYLTGNTKISVEECGIKVGYNNLYNYSRWFKSITGVSPSTWKNSHNSNPTTDKHQ